ncbi:hypothetical protein M2139_001087 [Enterococcus sp. PF1-24]|uniref:hypothetical protein n=1 Tax=unclassified Enterococcus TaxID=2608891 RepID=UPI002476B2F5|nr:MULTISPECIES: hypothetical protein [unclassified Enterococcus]MDH6364102.1 hypothetical protein [Enterococcus sp. PFB1-1]MDH6401203.1 hypothetical protein [Enterococcus sp. PF1-24]
MSQPTQNKQKRKIEAKHLHDNQIEFEKTTPRKKVSVAKKAEMKKKQQRARRLRDFLIMLASFLISLGIFYFIGNFVKESQRQFYYSWPFLVLSLIGISLIYLVCYILLKIIFKKRKKGQRKAKTT